MAAPRVIVIGAGPAGVRAAAALVEAGLQPVVIDEGRRDGGQIYRRQPPNFSRPYAALYGSEAAKAEALHRAFDALRPHIDYRAETLAWNIADGQLHTVCGKRAEALPFDALVVCSGATDRLLPLPGWNRAGCYSLGAAQIALKAQACAIGSRIVFCGTGPLLYLVASQYLKAGARIAAVIDTSPQPALAALGGLLARPALLLRGLGLIATLRRAGVPLLRGATPLAIDGDDETGVAGIIVRDANGRERRFDCDAVALGYHLRAETQLADLARCEFRFDDASRQWLPAIDEDGRASSAGIYLAGDGVRLAGADAAEAAGRLAALAVLHDLGVQAGSTRYEAERDGLRATLATMERFRRGLAAVFPWPHTQAAALPDDAVVCRCETIAAGELRRSATELGGCELNRAKAFSRVGMGRCQGRYCGHAAAEIVAAATGVPVQQVGRLRGQAPVKPLPLDVEVVQ